MLGLPSAEYLSLVYRPDLLVLVGRWLRDTLPQEMYSGYGLMLDGAEDQQCRFWLVDARRRDNGTNGQNVRWMMDTFFPQVVTRLGQPVFIAYLFAPSHLNDIIADPAIPSLSYFDNRPYRVERFIEERAALEWLASCQTVVVAR